MEDLMQGSTKVSALAKASSMLNEKGSTEVSADIDSGGQPKFMLLQWPHRCSMQKDSKKVHADIDSGVNQSFCSWANGLIDAGGQGASSALTDVSADYQWAPQSKVILPSQVCIDAGNTSVAPANYRVYLANCTGSLSQTFRLQVVGTVTNCPSNYRYYRIIVASTGQCMQSVGQEIAVQPSFKFTDCSTNLSETAQTFLLDGELHTSLCLFLSWADGSVYAAHHWSQCRCHFVQTLHLCINGPTRQKNQGLATDASREDLDKGVRLTGNFVEQRFTRCVIFASKNPCKKKSGRVNLCHRGLQGPLVARHASQSDC